MNNNTGNDTWDGQSPAYNNTTGSGPKLSIKNATETVTINGTVNIAHGIYSGENNTNIQITHSMNIIGESQTGTIINGENTFQIFRIQSGVTVTMENLTLIHGRANSGGAIYNNGTLTILNSTFKDNTAADGGVIYNTGSLAIQNSTFTGNRAFDDSGGAIFNYDGSILTVTGSTFTSNTATYGGAICNYNYSSLRDLSDMDRRMVITDVFNGTYTTMAVNNCTFTSNSAGYYGGAITNDNYSNLTVTDCNFTGNTAERYGGAINNDFYSTATVNCSIFNDNGAVDGSGGAIDNYYYGNCYLINCNFTGNTANFGGALCNDDDGPLNVTGCTFIHNSAKIDGGAINDDDDSVTTVKNSVFIGNTATNGNGGAIDNYYSTLTVTSSTFTGNLAQNGGAIDNIYGKETLNNCIFADNNATVNGGAVYTTGTTGINGSTFSSHNATNGGAIYNNIGTLTINQSTFQQNRALNSGGAIYSAGSPHNWRGILIITNSTVNQNNATTGGGIYNTGTLTIINTTMNQNNATNGGAIYTAIYPGNVKTVTVTGSLVNQNQATQGCFIYNAGSNCEIHFNSITGNSGTILYSTGGTMHAQENWWGSNNPNFTLLIIGTADYSPWLYMRVNATPGTINNTENSTINVNFNYLYNGITVTALDPALGHIPDGVMVTLSVPWGSFAGSQILHSLELQVVNCTTSARFYASEGAVNSTYNPVMVTTTAGDYPTNGTESIYITINPAADMYLMVTSNNNNPVTGEPVVLSYKLGNRGPDTADNVMMSIRVPEEFYISGIRCDGTWFYNETTRIITWNFSSVLKGDPYLYLEGWFVTGGGYSFNASILSSTYNLNIYAVKPLYIEVNAPENINTTVDADKGASTQVNAVKIQNMVRMQNTGVPIWPMILGILGILGGLYTTRRK